ncbi:resolvase-like protein [Maritimibacter alkaliphilus HTCC2654]|uniref:Resolvase, N-terminal n=1 Tax=Maritimibacter alkaliphilus HTCC2654 TaxID=314271 RepID=A3VEF3_9RHOB|nr:recombinase family protein [Maritimibacter alkaliphilus]EAQ13291.1 Resolvase, N-terminal [Rhodobacterales bacterium HTCC2654] [Maritimibacter alkaliphilus HTCC2654]TYP85286.1 resolvase-like protein [Maritimibacter alkaliphilus HTCC2654]
MKMSKSETDLGKLAVGYARVSTTGQGDKGTSLEAQRRAIRTFSDHMGYRLIEVFEDAASGAHEKSFNMRPNLNHALDCMKENDAILVVYDWDRFSRYRGVPEQLKKRGISKDRVLCVKSGEDLRRASEAAVFERASFDREMISRRTKDGMAAKKRAGETFGNPDIKNVQASGVKAYSAKADRVVHEIVEHIRRGTLDDKDSCGVVAKKLNAAGLLTAHDKSWNKDRVKGPLRKARALIKAEQSSESDDIDEEGYEHEITFGMF